MSKNVQKEILDSIRIITEKIVKKSTPQVLFGTVNSIDSDNSTCDIVTSNTTYTLPYYGGLPSVNGKSPIVVPPAGISQAFVVGGASDKQQLSNRYYFFKSDEKINRGLGTQGTIRQISRPYALVVQPTNTTQTRCCYIYTSNKIVLTDWKKAVVNFQGVFIEDTGGTMLRLGTSHTQVANPELRYKSYVVSAGNNSIVLDVSDLIGEYYLVIYGFLGGGVNDRWYSCLITDFYLEA